MLGFEWDATAMSKIYGYYGLAHFGRNYANLTADDLRRLRLPGFADHQQQADRGVHPRTDPGPLEERRPMAI